MSIKPEYATQIFNGTKQFEFRRSIFKKDVKIVQVYATMPVGKVIGEFEISEIISDTPERLYERTKEVAGIDRESFMKYFKGKEVAYAIGIKSYRLYDKPRELNARPPQSYQYV